MSQSIYTDNVVFNNEGVCSACLYENSKLNKQQWLERDQKLNKIVNWAKKNKTSSYDCIILISVEKTATGSHSMSETN